MQIQYHINLEISRIIGDKSNFAIHYRSCPTEYNYAPTDKMAICHLIIGNNLIGHANEECYLPTWLYYLTDMRNQIADLRHMAFPKEFEGLNDREIFEIILKANQLEDRFHPDYLYLPQLDNKIWSTYSFSLDETINAYLIYFYVKNDKITFLIEDETDSLKSDYRSYKFLFHSILLDTFFTIIDETTEFLLQHYPYLKGNISTRTF